MLHYHIDGFAMLQRAISPIRRRLDRSGIVLSGLCALHCLASIVIVSGLGVGGQFFFHPDIHRIGLALAVLIAAVAIGWGALRHRRAAHEAEPGHRHDERRGALAVPHGFEEAVLTIIGVALVSLGHVLNLRNAH